MSAHPESDPAGTATGALIGPGDPPPFSIQNEDGRAPFLLVCDHASRAIPRAMRQLGVADWVLERHVAFDIGAADLTRALARRFDAPAVMAGYSRLIIDLNRDLGAASSVVRVSDGIAIPGNLDLDEAAKQQRVTTFFDAYHGAIAERLDAFERRGQVPALISVHSCAPVYRRAKRPWHIGVMWDRDPRIARALMARLSQVDGLCVGDNQPYSGRHAEDFTVDHHGERRGLPCVGVEVRQDLLDTPENLDRWARTLGDAFDKVLGDSSLYTRRPMRRSGAIEPSKAPE